MKWTKKRVLILTRRMWRWLANNPTRIKAEWPGWKAFKTRPVAECFCCFWDKIERDEETEEECYRCPLAGYVWSETPTACFAQGSPYHKWAVLGRYAAQLQDRADPGLLAEVAANAAVIWRACEEACVAERMCMRISHASVMRMEAIIQEGGLD